jgi:hypothetical protein
MAFPTGASNGLADRQIVMGLAVSEQEIFFIAHAMILGRVVVTETMTSPAERTMT